MAEYHYKYTDPCRNKKPVQKKYEPIPWGLILFLFFVCWPVGLLLLLVRLHLDRTERSKNASVSQPLGSRTSANQRIRPAVPVKDSGKVMTIVGAILTALFGFVSLVVLAESLWMLPDVLWLLEELIPLLGVLGGSAALLWCGLRKQKQTRRFRKYLSLIGKRQTISISALAQAMPASHSTVCKDLEAMLECGLFPAGFLNYGRDELVLSDAGLSDTPPCTEPQPTPSHSKDEIILAEIRAVNDSIAHKGLSDQIQRIEEITAKILAYQNTHPEKAAQLRTFLNYYLPTTLKILHAYARLESQGVEGENITAAMVRIEDMMATVVKGFEKQLDQLFQTDAMDITSDVEVLERMLSKDGLSSADGLRLEI